MNPNPTQDTQPRWRYNAALANDIEHRWQDAWAKADAFRQPNPGEPAFDPSRPKFYCLDMFPYPSGAGLHVGHPEGYTATDIICRLRRMKGYNVLHPMGWDAFGLPAEQYAIQTGIHPAITTRKSIDNFRRQLQRFGFSYDWSRECGTIDEDYYRWTQWIFLRIYNAWFDPAANKARHIDELIAEFASGARAPVLNPHAAEYSGAGDFPDGTPIGPWATLDDDTRRMIVDSYRLAYVALQTVNWCPKLGTVLANDEVIDGRSERGGYPVFRKPLKQWMFRITACADRLLQGLDTVDWPEATKTQQREWIGRSEGAEVDFPILENNTPTGMSLRIFTTRPDTIFGATYMVVAPEHPLVDQALSEPSPETPVEALHKYVQDARNRSDIERQESHVKTGVFTGVYCLNPAANKPIPVWTSDYVLMGYGTGAIMAVPGQDQRDWDFAKAFNLPIIRTVRPPEGFDGEAYTGDGPAINSSFLDGLHMSEAKARIIEWLESRSLGVRRVNYRLRDWTFSRQRYWGEPIPIVFDERGRHYPLAPDRLPLKLPELADYAPIESDEPQALLAKARDWMHTTAAAAGVADLPPDTPLTREANTMPGSAGSSWYFLRYCDARNQQRFVGAHAEKYWMNVDLYLGGSEHAVGHLLYARFWQHVLYDLGEVSTPEPFQKLFHQGLILSHAYQRADKTLVPVDQVVELRQQPDSSYAEVFIESGKPMHRTIDVADVPTDVHAILARGGSAFVEVGPGADFSESPAPGKYDVRPVSQIVAKMSKSLKNVVNPDEIIADYGADTFRLYEMYMGPLEASKPWNTRDIAGLFRFLQRLWRLLVDEDGGHILVQDGDPDAGLEKLLHRLIARVASDVERLAFNTAIAAMIEFVNHATAQREKGGPRLNRSQAQRLALVVCPFAPHIAEELWHRLGGQGLASLQPWPAHDEALLKDDAVEIAIQVMGKVRHRMLVPTGADAAAVEQAVLAEPKVLEILGGKPVKKVVVVPGRMVNIVHG